MASPACILALAAALVISAGYAHAEDKVTQKPKVAPTISEWSGPSDPLAQRLLSFFRALDLRDENKAAAAYDIERGFANIPDDLDVIDTEAELRNYARRMSKHLAGYETQNRILNIQPLGKEYVAVLSSFRGVAHYAEPNRPSMYSEFRQSWVLRIAGDSFKIVQKMEAPLGPLPYVRKMHQYLADHWKDLPQ